MTDPWDRAATALALLAIDPAGLGGLWLRARSGPVRDRFTDALATLPLPRRRLHPTITDEQLFGGVDLAATLSAGKVVMNSGLLGTASAFILTMAERTEPGLAARLATALDNGPGHCLIALDEGADAEEALPSALADRLALHIDLSDIPLHGTTPLTLRCATLAHAREILPGVAAEEAVLSDLTSLAARLGIGSLRAPLLALRAAKAHAAFLGHDRVETEDITCAVALVYAPRATQIPETAKDEQEPQPEPESEPAETPDTEAEKAEPQLPEELLLEAVKAALPADLLARLAAGRQRTRGTKGSGSGAKQKGNRRGRPLPSRAGRLGTAKIDLVATLRAAAPWQPIRRALSPRGQGLHIRPGDLRLKRYEQKSDRLLIFTVDASGSAAVSRLNEAKGAVELLLNEAYARRDHVALVAFRGDGADVLLPPTRSLVQTKRRLAALPGGGGTPLASGLRTAAEMAHQAKSRGMTPTLALLTDGRANIALDGSPGRTQAGADAETVARSIRAAETPALVIDVANRPQRDLRGLAETMDATYLPLPRADAERLSTAVSAALDG